MWLPYHKRPSFACRRKQPKQIDPSSMHLMKSPNRERLNCENVSLNGMEIGHASMQGFRVTMEDEHIIEPMETLPDHTLVAIMDGKSAQSHIYLLLCFHVAFLT